MNKMPIRNLFFLILVTALKALPAQQEVPMNDLCIDDFSKNISFFGTSWEGFTDQVMGGKSEMYIGYKTENDKRYLSFSGQVRLENSGGFIQARLLLASQKQKDFDASQYTGIKASVRGKGNDYYIFLRAKGNRFPWSFFMAPIPVTREWTEITIPFSSFKKGDFGSLFNLDTRKLTSLALSAYKKAFDAEIDIREISFYK